MTLSAAKMGILERRIADRTLRVGVVGLGTVGLPLATACADAGYRVLGIDKDRRLIAAIQQGRHDTVDVGSRQLRTLLETQRLTVTSGVERMGNLDCVLLTVPVRLTRHGPSPNHLMTALSDVRAHLTRPKLIIVISTTYPGCLRTVLLPFLQQQGQTFAQGFWLAYSPERMDPGSERWPLKSIPRLVAGADEESTRLATMFLASVVQKVIVVSSPEVAELAKLFENVFRFVNISLVNELAAISSNLGIPVNEVLEAAESKPFAFLRHNPGLGVGGVCLPYALGTLRHFARKAGVSSPVLEAAAETDAHIVPSVCQAIRARLSERNRSSAGSPKAFVIGVGYKTGVADTTESKAVDLLRCLRRHGLRVAYWDPMVKQVAVAGERVRSSALSDALLDDADVIIIANASPEIVPEILDRHRDKLITTPLWR